MKIFTTEKIRAWDAYTIENEPIASLALMNRAAETFADWFAKTHTAPNQKVLIVCGTGNNGGDGVAVARLLHYLFFEVKILVCDFSGRQSADFQAQIEALPPHRSVEIECLKNAENLPAVPSDAVVVDAIFGTGLTRAPEGDFEKIIAWMNALPNEIVSIDLPSGLFADAHTPGSSVMADRTFSFERPKLAFFFAENAGRVGEWTYESIGLHPGFEAATETRFHFFSKKEASQLLRKRGKFDHKGTFGHALLVCGSRGKAGASVLAARACLRSGVGLLTVHGPGSSREILQISVPEAMFSADADAEVWTSDFEIEKYATVGVGPGIGTSIATANALEHLLRHSDKPLVLDADALNLLAENPAWWSFLPKNSILTPHPKEFERLFGRTSNQFIRNELQRKMAQQHDVFILLKGAFSALACPDGSCWFNPTGNPGMATGGSGDVLTGILTGLLAQGYAPFDAARLGAFLHGLAGDLAAEKLTEEGLIAGDLIDFLPLAWAALRA